MSRGGSRRLQTVSASSPREAGRAALAEIAHGLCELRPIFGGVVLTTRVGDHALTAFTSGKGDSGCDKSQSLEPHGPTLSLPRASSIVRRRTSPAVGNGCPDVEVLRMLRRLLAVS